MNQFSATLTTQFLETGQVQNHQVKVYECRLLGEMRLDPGADRLDPRWFHAELLSESP